MISWCYIVCICQTWGCGRDCPPTYSAPSRLQFDTSRSYPATPRPSVNPFLRPAHSAPSLGYVRDIISPKGKIPAEKEPRAVMKESKFPHSHLRDVTLPEVTTLVQEQHAVVEESKSSYDQAHEYVERFNDWYSRAGTTPSSLDAYEKTFSIKMTMKEWIKLSNDLNILETDQRSVVPLQHYLRSIAKYTNLRYPRYSYYSPTSTLIIQCMPSPIHESITSIFTRGFNAMQESLPNKLSSRINTTANEDFNGFEGNYTGSTKTPDLAVQFENDDGNPEIKFVLEVGFSETYEDLVRDAKLWLEGQHEVSIVVLVKFEETPSYRCPVRDENFETLEFPSVSEIKFENFKLQEEYGPVVYEGLQWVGRISAAYMEVWKRDSATGLATKNGNRIVGYP